MIKITVQHFRISYHMLCMPFIDIIIALVMLHCDQNCNMDDTIRISGTDVTRNVLTLKWRDMRHDIAIGILCADVL